MPFHLVFFSTDVLIYVLVIAIGAVGIYGSRRPPWRAAWRQVAQSRLGMVALIVLLCYLLIGLLDSVHVRTERGGVSSLFDLAVSPLGQQDEQTYSAPLATRLYTKSIAITPGGKEAQVYARLAFGGKDLRDPTTDRRRDIVSRLAWATLGAVAVWATLCALGLALSKRRGLPVGRVLARLVRGETETAWREILLTVLAVLWVGAVAAALAAEYHLFGTDKVGKDIFYEALKSVRTGLVIGTLTTLIMLPFAVFFGTVAGYFGGWVDDGVQYVYTTLSSIPGVLLIVACIIALQIYIFNHPSLFPTLEARADARLLALCVVLGITSWTGLCRLLRGETLKLREVSFVEAARALGASRPRIIVQHILPNVLHIVLITAVLDFSGLVLAEAVLSYVGIGVDPTTISWGNMINSARLELAREPVVWWPIGAAFVFMFVLVLAANLFADAVRDAFDPRLRHAVRRAE